MPLLEEYLPFFVEEPVVPELSDRIGDVVRSTSIPVATGERLYSRWDFKKVLESGVAVAQPTSPTRGHLGGTADRGHGGGVRRLAGPALPARTHRARGLPPGGVRHPNLLIQEQSLGIHYNEGSDLLDYLVDPSVFHYDDGHVGLLTAPGLGIEIDEKAVERAAETGHRWRNPVWRRDDGSQAEW